MKCFVVQIEDGLWLEHASQLAVICTKNLETAALYPAEAGALYALRTANECKLRHRGPRYPEIKLVPVIHTVTIVAAESEAGT